MSFIKIDSAARTNPLTTSPSQCIIRSANYLFKGRYNLKLAYIPMSFYNVTAANNVVAFTDTIAHKVIVRPGYYDNATILTAVAAAMTAVGSITYTAVKDAITQNVTISANTGTFVLNFSNTTNSLADLLGYPPVDTSAASSHMSTDMSNLSQIRSLNFAINNITNIRDLSGSGAFTFIVPIAVNQLGIQVYEPVTFEQSVTFDVSTRDLSITIYDDKYRPIVMQEDYYLILQSVCA
jgi:hypothetical protein